MGATLLGCNKAGRTYVPALLLGGTLDLLFGFLLEPPNPLTFDQQHAQFAVVPLGYYPVSSTKGTVSRARLHLVFSSQTVPSPLGDRISNCGCYDSPNARPVEFR